MELKYNPNYPDIPYLRKKAKQRIRIRTGPDIACTLARGAEFTFMGRSVMYGVAALGKHGGTHTISILKTQLQLVMEQLCCENVPDFPNHLIAE